MPTPLLYPLFSTPELEKLFSSEQTFAHMLHFEANLAEVQSDIGLINPNVAGFIRQIRPLDLETGKIAREAAEASNLAVPFVKNLIEKVEKLSPDAARYVHFGATSQDVLDTALIMQMKTAIGFIETDLAKLKAVVASLANKHKLTVMPARTLLQQAMPTTFGLKMVSFLDALMRHDTRLVQMKARFFALQLGGAAGTLAGYGTKANELTARLAMKLNLAPALPFHAHRDRILEAAHMLSSLALSCGKMASDIILMMQTEVGEVFEGAGEGRGGSSAMPHKRNPALSTLVVAGCGQLNGLMANLYANSFSQHERAAGAWQAEWLTFPLIVKITGAVTSRMVILLDGLEVNAEKMRTNLEITHGLVYSEKLKSALVPLLGRTEAHKIIEIASKEAISKGKHLKNTLPNEVLKSLDKAVLDNLFDPINSIGDAVVMVERVLSEYHNSSQTA